METLSYTPRDREVGVAEVSSHWKNQIVGYGEEPPESLLAHPQNPKIHPKRQQDALTGSLSELGWIAVKGR